LPVRPYKHEKGDGLSAGFFNPFPKYLQVRHILRRRLGRELALGDRLPTEHELMQQFAVSRETVREALRGLEEDGLIRRRRGWGTVVVKLPGTGPDERLTGLVDDFTELKLNTEAEVLSKGVEALPAEVAALLHMSASEPMYRIRRRRLLESLPLAFHDCYLPLEIGVAIGRLDLNNTTVLHEISTTLGEDIHEDCQHIDASIADTEMAEVLNVPAGAPLLIITRVFGIDSHGPIMFFRAHFRSDRYYYTVQLAHLQHRRRATSLERPDFELRNEGEDIREKNERGGVVRNG
jgi:GntR family transcriptional regulator